MADYGSQLTKLSTGADLCKIFQVKSRYDLLTVFLYTDEDKTKLSQEMTFAYFAALITALEFNDAKPSALR